jgi:hypothetical protein
METMRYDFKKNCWNSYWSVIDVFTGQPVVVDRLVVDCLTHEEANYMVDLMNLQDLLHRKALKLH